MTSRYFSFLLIVFLVVCLAGVVQGWQGRMSGMEEPIGLVQDESDFLTHPAYIADGKGINYYGDARLKYSDITKLSYSENSVFATGSRLIDYATSGHLWEYSGQIGAALPMGSGGRLGIFFQYSGTDGKLDGNEQYTVTGVNSSYAYNLKNDFDSYALRLIYGIPVSKDTKFGAEFQLAYKTEKDHSFLSNADGSSTVINSPYGSLIYFPYANLLHFGIPMDSRYYEAIMKGSVATMIGPATASITI
jgi:hypothetical protein